VTSSIYDRRGLLPNLGGLDARQGSTSENYDIFVFV